MNLKERHEESRLVEERITLLSQGFGTRVKRLIGDLRPYVLRVPARSAALQSFAGAMGCAHLSSLVEDDVQCLQALLDAGVPPRLVLAFADDLAYQALMWEWVEDRAPITAWLRRRGYSQRYLDALLGPPAERSELLP